MTTAILAFMTVAFLIVTGANEGGVIATLGMHYPSLRPIGAVLVLGCGSALIPLLVGTGVARTLATGLTGARVPDQRAVFGLGLCGALVVVGVLTFRRMPTSLSLALVGGIAGAALGAGAPVDWSRVAIVLSFGVTVPVAGAFAGTAGAFILRCLNGRRWAVTAINGGGLVGYLAQVVAYGANGGQKMTAVYAVCDSTARTPARPTWSELALIGGCFTFGALLSVRRLAGRFRADLVRTHPPHELAAGLASALALLASAGASMPVSSTQVTASALIGAGASDGVRRVRWPSVTRLGSAWLVTLPASVGVAASAGLALRTLR